MKKKILSIGIISILIIMLVLLTGCGNDNNNTNEQVSSNTEENNIEEVSQQETIDGTYTYTYSNAGQEVDGTKETITLQNGKITFKRDYYDMTKTGTYTVEDNVVIATYTESSSFSEGEDKVITEKISEEEKYSIVDNGLQYSDTYNNKLYVKGNVGNSNDESNTNQNTISSVEDVVIAYNTELYKNFDVKKAYEYYDYTGLYTWLKSSQLPRSNSSSIKAEKFEQFMSDYNNNKNNSELQEKIKNFVNETYTDEKFKEIDEEVKKDRSNIVGNKKHEVVIDIIDSKEIKNDLYEVSYKVTYKLENGNGYGGDKRYVHVICNDGKYFIISPTSRYDEEYNGLSKL